MLFLVLCAGEVSTEPSSTSTTSMVSPTLSARSSPKAAASPGTSSTSSYRDEAEDNGNAEAEAEEEDGHGKKDADEKHDKPDADAFATEKELKELPKDREA